MPQPSDLITARLAAGLSVTECCNLTGKHRTTWQRMERGVTRVDRACLRLLELLASLRYRRGRPFGLGTIHPAWHGYLIDRDGDLYLPGYARGYTPAILMRLPWLLQIAAMHQTPLRQSPIRRILSKLAS